MENQIKAGRELFEINTQVARRMSEIAGEGIKQYFETNQTFAKRLGEVRDVTSFVELQRDYSKTLYNGLTERLQTQGEVVKDAVERGGEVLRGAFTSAEVAAEEAPAANEVAANEVAADEVVADEAAAA